MSAPAGTNGGSSQYTYAKCRVDGCSRRHPGGEDACWVAHPELNPRNHNHNRGDRGRGRGQHHSTRGSRGGGRATAQQGSMQQAHDQSIYTRGRGRGRGRGGGRVAFAARSSRPTATPKPQSKQLESSFHALPQEIQDRIYEKMYEPYGVTATSRKNPHRPRRYHLAHRDPYLQLWGLPKRNMELACKKNLADAEQVRKAGFNGHLGIVYSEHGGFTPMCALQDEELGWLRNMTTTIHFTGFDGKSLAYSYPSADVWANMDRDFPVVQEIHLHYNVLRYAYEDRWAPTTQTQEYREIQTPEWRAAFKLGQKDVDFTYPASSLRRFDLARIMEERDTMPDDGEAEATAEDKRGDTADNGTEALSKFKDDESAEAIEGEDEAGEDEEEAVIINGEIVGNRGCKIYLTTRVDFMKMNGCVYQQVCLAHACEQ